MQSNGADPSGSPIEYPTVTVDGQEYQVKFSNRAIYRLDKAGVDLQQFGEKLKSGRVGMSQVFDLLAATIQTPPHVPRLDAEELSEKVSIGDATRAILQSMGKAQPPAELKLREAANDRPLQ